MAKLVLDDNEPKSIRLMYSVWRMAAIGVFLGILYWLLTILMSRYVIDPIYCGSSVDTSVCASSIPMAGNIVSIIVATIGLGIMIRYSVVRPIIIAVASAIALWGLAGWTEGLVWYEIGLWSALLYGFSYVLFSWISRYNRTVPVLVAILATLIILRVAVLL